MRQISSRQTFLYKRVYPLLAPGFFAFFVVDSVRSSPDDLFPPLLFGAFAIASYFLLKRLSCNLADVVFDAGDYLIVRRGCEEDRILMSEIAEVSNRYALTLTLQRPIRFGTEVSFVAPQKLFGTSPIMAELIERVDAARRTHA